jgi:hypothetical protein
MSRPTNCGPLCGDSSLTGWRNAEERPAGYQVKAGDHLYEPSSPSPRSPVWLLAAMVAAGAVVIIVEAWRRLRVESRMACFALLLAAIALIGGWWR